MSQAKVDKYKKEKANRQKIMKREKRLHRHQIQEQNHKKGCRY